MLLTGASLHTHSYAFPVYMCIPQTSLEDDLNAMEMSMSQALQVADAQKCTMREQLLDEMAGYKVKHFPLTRWGCTHLVCSTIMGNHSQCSQS